MVSLQRQLWAAAWLVSLAACSDATEPIPAPELEFVALGRVERGGEVRLRVVRGNDTLPASAIVVSAAPASIATVDADHIARLVGTGPVTFSAVVGDTTMTLVRNVVLPPLIAFEMISGGNRDIWAIRLDGGDLVRVSNNVADDRWPTGAVGRVVFSSTRSSATDLYALSAPLGTEDRLTTTSTLSETEPALSPDGQRLAFIGIEAGPLSVGKLFVGAGNGSGTARVTTEFGNAGSLEASPAWSPNSEHVAFVTTHAGSADIWKFSVAGAALSPLVQHSGADVDPAWSPDGNKLVFASNRDAPDAELYLLDVPTGGTIRLTTRPGVDAQPCFLPDGRIVYTAYEGTVSTLRWLDPEIPTMTHSIPTGAAASKPVPVEWPSS